MRLGLYMLVLALLSGCAHYQAGVKNPLIRASYDAADQLAALSSPMVAKDAPLIVATFVNIDRLTESSTLGRVLAEQVAARFTQRGYPMVELKLRGNVFVREGKGELLLSREVKDISLAHNVQAVVVGTYAVTPDKIFLNLKIVRPMDNRVLSAHNIALDLDETTQALLQSETS
ncbi:FlgO family outer membrane protein [Chitinimonas naiadis]